MAFLKTSLNALAGRMTDRNCSPMKMLTPIQDHKVLKIREPLELIFEVKAVITVEIKPVFNNRPPSESARIINATVGIILSIPPRDNN